jgi:hypothetical protein
MLNELENFIRNNKEAFDAELPSNLVWQTIENKIVKKDENKIISSSSLEKNITANKIDFDTEEPSAKVWENIAATVLPKKQAKVFTLKDIYKWSAAAAVFFIIATSAYFLFIHKSTVQPAETATTQPTIQPITIETLVPKKDTVEEEIGAFKTNDMAAAEDKNIVVPDPRDKIITKQVKSDEPTDMFKIITTKQAELKELTKDKPYLYQEFTADLRTLESSYGVLKKQVNQTPNSDVIIKAMMQNLQLQAELLGRQLTIINNIKKDKQNEKSNSRYN